MHAHRPERTRSSILRLAGLAAALAAGTSSAALAQAPVLNSLQPKEQVVHGYVVLKGSGFGSYQPGVSEVLFLPAPQMGGGMFVADALPDGTGRGVGAGTPYVWRDDFIQVRVPVGREIGGVHVPISKGPLRVRVRTANGLSNGKKFQVSWEDNPTLAFTERTLISGNLDQSGFMGTASDNMARCKDSEIGDVNADGWPDLLDNTSNNLLNGTHGVLRLNKSVGLGFQALNWEPLTVNDTGSFMVVVPAGGDYYADGITYDADFVDLNNDELPDYVQAVGQATGRLRIAINGHMGVAGRFIEATKTWVNTQPPDKSLDDVDHWDLNLDGWVDVATAARFSPRGYVYLNNGGTTFHPAIVPQSTGSIHDNFILDYNLDGWGDVVLVSESTPAQLFESSGGAMPTFQSVFSFPVSSYSGGTADFNADGWPDVVFCGNAVTRVYLNGGAGGGWIPVPLAGALSLTYDIEVGDIDLDGDVDLIGAAINTPAGLTCAVWLNDGDGGFTNLTQGDATKLLPGLGPYQRLSADLIDFDLDGDLDLYLTGADGQDVYGGGGFGRVPNQFFENLVR